MTGFINLNFLVTTENHFYESDYFQSMLNGNFELPAVKIEKDKMVNRSGKKYVILFKVTNIPNAIFNYAIFCQKRRPRFFRTERICHDKYQKHKIINLKLVKVQPRPETEIRPGTYLVKLKKAHLVINLKTFQSKELCRK